VVALTGLEIVVFNERTTSAVIGLAIPEQFTVTLPTSSARPSIATLGAIGETIVQVAVVGTPVWVTEYARPPTLIEP
jgi:hypothetical protein